MADVLDQVRDVVDGQIVTFPTSLHFNHIANHALFQDFEGQKVTELLATILLVISGALSFLVGYMLQDIKLAVYVGLGGTGLTFLAVVPPWPIFNKNPVKWLPAGYTVDMAESKSSQ
ncbi:hypothetical protein AK830_g10482 [Neonectria ditissima]|uniref:Signal peptidase complex subunit 1 n=1 Tax=Neonectria ditissima TaxID=78410 RepID=A0A0N8H5G2_9HYPO|nr:hypothetical protein AK830_g10482 [Neonectria ditissima]